MERGGQRSPVNMPLASAGPDAIDGSVDPGCFLHNTVKKAAIDSRGNESHSLPKSSSGEKT